MYRETLSPVLHTDWGYNRLPASRHHKVIVLSDLHFPRRDNSAELLYEFLLHNTCDTLILLGDTHEGYDAKLHDFKEMNYRVWDLIAARKAQGMKVIDIAGNHDAYKRGRGLMEHSAFGTEYWNEMKIASALGDVYVFHGDALDGNMTKRYDKLAYKIAKKIAIGDRSLLDVHSALEKLSYYLFKGKGAKTNSLQTEFAAVSLAFEKDCRSVLMGHTHMASDFQEVDGFEGSFYGNTGSWVGGMATCMVMKDDGTWERIDWSEERRGLYAKKARGIPEKNGCAEYRDSSVLEFAWQKAQHSLYVQELLVREAHKAIENVEKVKNRVRKYIDKAEEKLAKAQDKLELAGRYAGVERLEKPCPIAPVFEIV